jgi:hypothetical protein
MGDEVPEARLDPIGTSTRLFGRPDEVPEVDPADRVDLEPWHRWPQSLRKPGIDAHTARSEPWRERSAGRSTVTPSAYVVTCDAVVGSLRVTCRFTSGRSWFFRATDLRLVSARTGVRHASGQ